MNAQSLPLLQEALSLAVPLRIRQFAAMPLGLVKERVIPHIAAIQSAAAFLDAQQQVTTLPEWMPLVEALAFLAFRPEGVTLFGLHWRATHPEDASQSLSWGLPVGAGREGR